MSELSLSCVAYYSKDRVVPPEGEGSAMCDSDAPLECRSCDRVAHADFDPFSAIACTFIDRGSGRETNNKHHFIEK